MRKGTFYASLGLLFCAISIILKKFDLFTDFTQGICAILGLTFILFSIIFKEYDLLKFINKK